MFAGKDHRRLLRDDRMNRRQKDELLQDRGEEEMTKCLTRNAWQTTGAVVAVVVAAVTIG